MSMIQSDLLLGQEGGASYVVQRSLRFNAPDSSFLSRTPSVAGNRKTWTWAGWVKRSGLGTYQNIFDAAESGTSNPRTDISFNSSDTLNFQVNPTGLSWLTLSTSQVFRDVSAWGHLVIAVDTTQATDTNRVKLYWNGAQITQFSSAQYPSQNSDLPINNTWPHSIGRYQAGASQYFSGLLADVFFIDGQALDPSSFVAVSATTGRLEPKQYTGSFGTNGFWLKFSDNSAATATTLGKDYSGNGNNWTPNNLSVTAGAGNDSLVDTPSSAGTDTGVGGVVTGNYCTFNPLDLPASGVFSNGNLEFNHTGGGGVWRTGLGTFALSSGKWYWEMVPTVDANAMIGIVKSDWSPTANSSQFWDSAGGYGYLNNGLKYNNASSGSYGASFTTNDVIGIALDLDAGTLVFYKNGVSQGTAYSGLSGTFKPAFGAYQTCKGIANFGQRQWAYAAPSGFRPLVDTLLPAPVVAKSSDYFQTVLYTGTGSSQSITGLSFSPDLVWIKNRTSGGSSHALFDVVRGADKRLRSNGTDSELSPAIYGSLTAFNSNGFTVAPGSDPTDPAIETCKASNAYIAWAFDAGTTTTTNTAGSITSSCRTNQSSGFSIVTYNHGSGVGASTIGHGLNSAPHLILSKYRDGTTNWDVYVRALGPGGRLILNSTGAFTSETEPWNNTNPTSTVFSVGPSSWKGVGNHVAYCFSPVAGYSSFGSYTGNGSADGPFVFTGMRPRWIMFKCSSTNNGYTFWEIIDTARPNTLAADLSDAEGSYNLGTGLGVDILSNGFKIRGAGSGKNLSSQTYIYAAFAENPFQYARAR